MASGLPKGLALPASGLKQDWLAYVAALPDADQPAVLGLPANIGRSIALGHSRRLLASLRQISAAQVGVAQSACRLCCPPFRPGAWSRVQGVMRKGSCARICVPDTQSMLMLRQGY